MKEKSSDVDDKNIYNREKKREKNERKEKQMANSSQQAALDGACVCVFSYSVCCA